MGCTRDPYVGRAYSGHRTWRLRIILTFFFNHHPYFFARCAAKYVIFFGKTCCRRSKVENHSSVMYGRL